MKRFAVRNQCFTTTGRWIQLEVQLGNSKHPLGLSGFQVSQVLRAESLRSCET
jgi:hypothetical protein